MAVSFRVRSVCPWLETIGFGQSVGPTGIKWVENMKPLFKLNMTIQSSIHTTDTHVANFFYQCEKLLNISHHITNKKCQAPPPPPPQPQPDPQPADEDENNKEITIIVNDSSKEIIKNSVKVSLINSLQSKSNLLKFFNSISYSL